jgi:hypothetical protein
MPWIIEAFQLNAVILTVPLPVGRQVCVPLLIQIDKIINNLAHLFSGASLLKCPI